MYFLSHVANSMNNLPFSFMEGYKGKITTLTVIRALICSKFKEKLPASPAPLVLL